MKQKFTRAQLGILITSCANIGIVLGLIVNISGLFFQPIMEELHTGIGKVSTTLAIYNVAFAISGLLFPKIAGRIRYKKLAVAGILGVILTTAATAYCRTLFGLYLMNTLRGLFAGLIGPVACTMIVNRWFLQGSGFFSGLVFGFSGIAGAVFSPIVSAVIEQQGWRSAYLLTAAVMVLFALPCFLFRLAYTPEEIDEEPYGSAAAEGPVGTETSAFDPKLYLLMFLFPIATGLAASFVQHLTPMASSYGFSSSVTSLMLSLVLIMNTAGKFLIGALIDRIGALRSTLLFIALVLIATVVYYVSRSTAGMYGASVLYGNIYALANIGLVALTKDLFGTGNYGRVYPKLNFAYTLTAAFGASFFGFMYDGFQSYRLSLILIFVLILACSVFEIYAYRKIARSK